MKKLNVTYRVKGDIADDGFDMWVARDVADILLNLKAYKNGSTREKYICASFEEMIANMAVVQTGDLLADTTVVCVKEGE